MDDFLVISRGAAAGSYQAFPDACRLKNGEILCVFYAGYGHVSLPRPDFPQGGRICLVRSRDDGRSWSEPAALYDDGDDNRDPHIVQLKDGTLVCTFFSLRPGRGGRPYEGIGVQMVRSRDNGRTWEMSAPPVQTDWYSSAPVRQLKSGVCLQGVYHEEGSEAYGGVLRSLDGGKSWSAPIPIGKGQGVRLDAETDLIECRDGTLYAALRSDTANMHFATSVDGGLSWSPATDIGFKGHSPHFTRLRDRTIVLTHRLPHTAMHVSLDECRTWRGPYVIDEVIGAYPSTVERRDGTLLVIYYSEGEGSAIRARRFRLTPTGLEPLPLR